MNTYFPPVDDPEMKNAAMYGGALGERFEKPNYTPPEQKLSDQELNEQTMNDMRFP
ncbi:MAG: hypothetical protein V4474_04375 [Patescibacteria group bacterium]